MLTTLLLYMVADAGRRGYKHLLEGFWDEARSHSLELPTEEALSAPSFCTARRKITPELLKHMLHEVASTSFETTFESQRWHGKRVLALDGTKVNLQRGHDLEVAFGVPNEGHCPQVLVSVLLDVCAKAPVDVEVAPFASSEREHLFAMLPSLECGDLIVLDRGYPSHEVLQALVSEGIDFLARLPSTHTFAAIDKLRESEEDDLLFDIDPPEGSPPDWTRITVRAVRLLNPDGNESFFFTTLPRADFNLEELRELYHMRWEAEEFYKLFKSPYIGQRQFRSKSPDGVRQEIHALVLFLAIARVLMAETAKTTGSDYESVSQKAAVLGLAAYITRLFLHPDTAFAARELHALIRRIAKTPYKRRPGRVFPRVSYRPRLRWASTGRVGG